MHSILKSLDPYEQKRLGRKVKKFNEAEWKLVSPSIMRKGNMAKVIRVSSFIANYIILFTVLSKSCSEIPAGID